MENKTQKTYKIIMLLILTIFITFLLTSLGMFQYFAGNNITNINKIITSDKDTQELIIKLGEFKSLIGKDFLGEIDEEKLNEGAIKGYIEALGDPYTEYIPKSDLEEVMEDTLGKFTGIGIYMQKDEQSNKIKIVAPIKEGPAEKVGVLAGDLILSVNNVEYTAEDFDKISEDIKSISKESIITLEVLRGTEKKVFEIKPDVIKVNPITSKIIDEEIGYIEFTSFDDGTAEEFKSKYDKLKESNIKSLIIDLRNNGGGIEEEAIKIADYILEKDKVILYEIDKNGNEEAKKSNEDPIIDIPIVILTNKNTASASEILAVALKENGKAKLVGDKTYGKGVIQRLIQFTDGSGIKITTEEYLTPNRNKINKIGIEPDEKVKLPDTVKNIINLEETEDTQLQKAIEIAKQIGE